MTLKEGGRVSLTLGEVRGIELSGR